MSSFTACCSRLSIIFSFLYFFLSSALMSLMAISSSSSFVGLTDFVSTHSQASK
ncbi:hypothetical protein HanRHA438_Chr08g0342261 [Helianthus annuus]|nr:hypothetical protein HanRHA438_Chr08g0342261 [Helianthus annuus]